MISHKHKCIFIHIPKAAGTSIERVFMDDLGLDMDNRHALLLGKNTNKTMGPRRVSHLTAQEMLDQHFISQELFDTYFKFAFVRHPVDRLYSIYRYRKFSDFMSFDNFILENVDKIDDQNREYFFYKPQFEYLCNNGKLMVDFVGKLENIERDFEYVRNKLKLKNNLGNHNTYKSYLNRSNIFKSLLKKIKRPKYLLSDRSKSKSLNNVSKDIILKIYKDDFKIFAYDMKN